METAPGRKREERGEERDERRRLRVTGGEKGQRSPSKLA
jgi:hypothetical protein